MLELWWKIALSGTGLAAIILFGISGWIAVGVAIEAIKQKHYKGIIILAAWLIFVAVSFAVCIWGTTKLLLSMSNLM